MGSLLQHDCEFEEDQADLEHMQLEGRKKLLHLTRLADSEYAEVDLDFGMTYNKGG